MNTDATRLARQFEAGAIDAGGFGHREHVLVAWQMLQRHEFLDATARYAKGIRAIADQAGVPEKFNLTITLAFMSLIAERADAAPHASAEAFLAANADLLEKDVLARWYSDDRLGSELARRQFLLPRPAAWHTCTV